MLQNRSCLKGNRGAPKIASTRSDAGQVLGPESPSSEIFLIRVLSCVP
ncbi:hypothetical protein TRICHSKD4_2934 [Roseibium sp. TrichSKD4]|nr:hypothetical protein TRICHSKD4_2934 [Roseibium sp. TrichSKD4]